MAILPIRKLPDPILRQKAKRVSRIDEYIQRLIDDMFETMHDAHGVGLAAPQVGVPLRIVVIQVPEHDPIALINPEVIRRKGQRWVQEGCLSIPGWRGELYRSVKVVAKGLTRDGREMRVHAQDDLLAQALEHETDHLNGILYIDRLDDPSQHLHRITAEEEEADREPPEVVEVTPLIRGVRR